MATIILDKNLATESRITVDRMFERPLDVELTGSKSFNLSTETPVIPTVSTGEFTTVEIIDDAGHNVPIIGSYNVIKNFSTEYYEAENRFSYTVILGVNVE